jgi:DNA-binding CsgD family transcriptional regulator
LETLKWRAETGNRWTWLSPRSRDVAMLVGSGRTYPQTAAALGISTHTVKTYVRRIAARLGSKETPQKAVIAYYHDYLKPTP